MVFIERNGFIETVFEFREQPANATDGGGATTG